MKVLCRQDLLEQYDRILERGLTQARLAAYRATGNFGHDVIVQNSSGSGGHGLLRLPRTSSDIANIFQRTLVPYFKALNSTPSRIAMLGGASHTEAALKMDLGGIQFRSFSLAELPEVESFDPEVISCYPNIARELYRRARLRFPSLKAFKLGGETVLPIDIELLTERFGPVAIFEQAGSTEMPALAIGLRERGKPRQLELQMGRFAFQPAPEGAAGKWRPLIARDDFSQLLFPVREYYDTGDLALYDHTHLFDLRRSGSEEHCYFGVQEELLRAGGTNVQISLEKRAVFVSDSGQSGKTFPEDVLVDGMRFRVAVAELERLPGSNKMRLLL